MSTRTVRTGFARGHAYAATLGILLTSIAAGPVLAVPLSPPNISGPSILVRQETGEVTVNGAPCSTEFPADVAIIVDFPVEGYDVAPVGRMHWLRARRS